MSAPQPVQPQSVNEQPVPPLGDQLPRKDQSPLFRFREQLTEEFGHEVNDAETVADTVRRASQTPARSSKVSTAKGGSR